MEFVEKIVIFNEIAGTKQEYDTKKVGLYVALVLEEVNEMLESLGAEETELSEMIERYRFTFKNGGFNEEIETALLSKEKRVEFLDAACDIAVVSLGAGIAVGGDVLGACNAVMENNLSKFPLVDGVHTVLRDDSGKVMKPEGFKSVELNQFINY